MSLLFAHDLKLAPGRHSIEANGRAEGCLRPGSGGRFLRSHAEPAIAHFCEAAAAASLSPCLWRRGLDGSKPGFGHELR
jgi:hypothetical protein